MKKGERQGCRGKSAPVLAENRTKGEMGLRRGLQESCRRGSQSLQENKGERGLRRELQEICRRGLQCMWRICV